MYIYLYLLTLIKALRGVGWQKKNCDTVNCDNVMENEGRENTDLIWPSTNYCVPLHSKRKSGDNDTNTSLKN